MWLKVTNAKTVDGHYFASGDIVEIPDAQSGSYRRIFRWEEVDAPVAETSVASLKKAELLDLADERGVEVPAKATKKDILTLLGE